MPKASLSGRGTKWEVHVSIHQGDGRGWQWDQGDQGVLIVLSILILGIRFWVSWRILGGKSPGPGGIYPRILSDASQEFAGDLAVIFVTSLGEVSEYWRIASYFSFVSEGQSGWTGNNRSVSLTSEIIGEEQDLFPLEEVMRLGRWMLATRASVKHLTRWWLMQKIKSHGLQTRLFGLIQIGLVIEANLVVMDGEVSYRLKVCD